MPWLQAVTKHAGSHQTYFLPYQKHLKMQLEKAKTP
jgi:hypothetical protein